MCSIRASRGGCSALWATVEVAGGCLFGYDRWRGPDRSLRGSIRGYREDGTDGSVGFRWAFLRIGLVGRCAARLEGAAKIWDRFRFRVPRSLFHRPRGGKIVGIIITVRKVHFGTKDPYTKLTCTNTTERSLFQFLLVLRWYYTLLRWNGYAARVQQS